jgi:hypothetical protein
LGTAELKVAGQAGDVSQNARFWNSVYSIYFWVKEYIMPKMTPRQAERWGKSLTFKKVWAALMETREMIAETTKQMAEQRKENERLLVEISRKHAEAVKERKKPSGSLRKLAGR